MPRPPKEIDFAMVHKLAACGLTVEQIGAVTGCDKRTIYRRCKRQMQLGRLEGEGKLQAKMWSTAMSGNVNMMIFLAKNRLGYVDRPETIVQVTQNALTAPLPTPTQMAERLQVAQKFLTEHRADFEPHSTEGNGA